MKDVFKRAGDFFKTHAPEIMENTQKCLVDQARFMAYIQQECTMVGMYIPKKKPETQEEIDELMDYFRVEMENAWKREAQTGSE